MPKERPHNICLVAETSREAGDGKYREGYGSNRMSIDETAVSGKTIAETVHMTVERRFKEEYIYLFQHDHYLVVRHAPGQNATGTFLSGIELNILEICEAGTSEEILKQKCLEHLCRDNEKSDEIIMLDDGGWRRCKLRNVADNGTEQKFRVFREGYNDW